MVLLDKKINGVDFEKIENHDMDRIARIETVKLAGKWYALSGWNGEKYYDCWEIEFSGYVGSPISDETFILEPVEIPVRRAGRGRGLHAVRCYRIYFLLILKRL